MRFLFAVLLAISLSGAARADPPVNCPPNSSPDPTTLSGCSCDVGYVEQPDGSCVAAPVGCASGAASFWALAGAAAALALIAARRRLAA